MDFHSHLAHTEIIGLLGGNFIQRDSTKILQVKLVFPCKSTSTGIQCEMDPASEMMAREVFSEKGFNVVGWYHSHPTFEPHPSIRDIENQTSYQVNINTVTKPSRILKFFDRHYLGKKKQAMNHLLVSLSHHTTLKSLVIIHKFSICISVKSGMSYTHFVS